MTKCFPFLLFFAFAIEASGQYFQFSQYNYASQRVSPAAVATSDYASVGFLYRNQGTDADIKLNTNLLSVAYPLMSRKGRRWSGVGMTLMDDRSGGIFTMQEASLSYAINVPIDQSQSVALGFKGLYQTRKIDLGGLYTGLQYVQDRGFDESLFNGENLGSFRSDYFTFSSGISWQNVDREGVRTAYAALSMFDINKPDESFLGEGERLSSTWVAAGSFRAFRESNMSVFPEVLYTRNAANNVLNVGFVTRCDVRGTRTQAPFHVNVLTKYVVGRSGIVGLQFHNESFSLGFSYDFLVHRDNVANVGAFEIGMELRRLVLRSPRVTRKPPVRNPATTVAKQVTPQKRVTATQATKTDSTTRSSTVKPKQRLAETLAMKKDSVVANARAGKISHEPFEIEKITLHFNFEFNSTDLDQSSTAYLDELTEALLENPHLRIRLTGHTDNVGSDNFNLRLSHYRANSIREYLISKGVSGERIAAEGKGMREPLNNNKTEEERAKNRRVELTIYYQE